MSVVSLFLTHQCNISCSHCCMNSMPSRKKYIDFDVLCGLVSKIDKNEYSTICITGGEPFLYGKKIFPLISHCFDQTKSVRLITNARWASTVDRAYEFLSKCYDSGLTELNISTSSYHQRFIPSYAIANAYASALSIPFQSVQISASAEDKASYNKSLSDFIGSHIPSDLIVKTKNFGIQTSRIQNIGRYKSNEIAPSTPRDDGKDPYKLRCPSSVDQPAISADGDLVACAGMDLSRSEFLNFGPVSGDTFAAKIAEMKTKVVPQAIRHLGPGYLAKFLEEKEGIEIPKSYQSTCEICQHVMKDDSCRALLKKHMPELGARVSKRMKERGVYQRLETDIEVARPEAPASESISVTSDNGIKGEIEALVSRSRGARLIAPDGKSQSWLIDLRPLFMKPSALREITQAFWSSISPAKGIQLAGMEVAAIPLLTGLLMDQPEGQNSNGLIIRKERKPTGLSNAIEGEITDAPVILVDDILNSGDSAEKARVVLADAGLTISEMFVVIDYRSRRGLDWRKKHGIKVTSLFTLDDFGLKLGSKKGGPKQEYDLVWRHSEEKPYPFYVVPKSTPLLADGSIVFGTDQAEMVSLDASTGRERWRFKTEGAHRKGIWSSPASHEGRLYFGAYNGNMYCLDHKGGELVWFNPACEWIGSSPLIVPKHGTLIVGLEYERPAAQGSMAAFRLSNGEKVWENYLKVYQHGSATYWEPGDLAICGTNDHTIMALHAKTGETAWVFPTVRSIKYAPAIDHERGLVVAASFDGNIYVLKAETGEKVAAFKTDNICYTTPLVTHGRIFCGSGDRHLYVIDLDTMELVKKIDFGARIYGSPKLIDGRVMFGSNGGVMREIDPMSLETLGRLQLTDAITNAISASEDGKRIYVPTYTNEIFCFDRV